MTDSPRVTIGVHSRLPKITGVQRLGYFRSSIRTDARAKQLGYATAARLWAKCRLFTGPGIARRSPMAGALLTRYDARS